MSQRMLSQKDELGHKVTTLEARLAYFRSVQNQEYHREKMAQFDEEVAKIEARRAQFLEDYNRAPSMIPVLDRQLTLTKRILQNFSLVSKVNRLKKNLAEAAEVIKDQKEIEAIKSLRRVQG